MVRERIAIGPSDRASRMSTRGVEVLAATRTLTYAEIERFNSVAFDCDGAARNLDLPATASCEGVYLYISNTTAATHALTVRDAAEATVIAVPATKAALVWCDGTRWYALAGA